MKLVEMDDILSRRRLRADLIHMIRDGTIFLYPTDTQYGIGCSAMIGEAVERVRRIKYTGHPFSVIAPSMEWIHKNMIVKNSRYLKKFPGPYTLIMTMKNNPVSKIVSGKRTLGVRIPNHPFTQLIQEAGVPFVTTSANMSGETPLWNTVGVPEGISRYVDIAIHDDILNNPASTIIDLTGNRARVIRKPTRKYTPFDSFEKKKEKGSYLR